MSDILNKIRKNIFSYRKKHKGEPLALLLNESDYDEFMGRVLEFDTDFNGKRLHIWDTETPKYAGVYIFRDREFHLEVTKPTFFKGRGDYAI